jgi:hypothetical protein
MEKVIGKFEERAQPVCYYVDFERRVWWLTTGKTSFLGIF